MARGFYKIQTNLTALRELANFLRKPGTRTTRILGAWQDQCYSEAAARAWIAAAPGFTPWTARLWVAQGFGPDDAAVWSEFYPDPAEARERRSVGYHDPLRPPTRTRP
jgi:hypothetical protein